VRQVPVCCEWRTEADSNRIERGSYVCDNCEVIAKSDLNAAERIELYAIKMKIIVTIQTLLDMYS